MRFHNFGPNWVQITHLPQKSFLTKIDCYCCIPIAFFHATTFKNIPQKENNKTEGCIRWPKLGVIYFSKQEFFGKVEQHYFGLAIVSHHVIPYQNIGHRVDHEYKVA